MLPQIIPLPVTMASRRNVEVSLNLVQYQTPIHSAAVTAFGLPFYPRCLRPFLTPPRRRNNIMHMFLPKPLIMLHIMIPLTGDHPTIPTPPQLMLQLAVHPLQPIRVLALQHLGCENAISRCIVHVDVDVFAFHCDYNVEVDLQVMADALFDEESVVFVAAPPVLEFGDGEEGGDEEDDDGPLSAARCVLDVLWF